MFGVAAAPHAHGQGLPGVLVDDVQWALAFQFDETPVGTLGPEQSGDRLNVNVNR